MDMDTIRSELLASYRDSGTTRTVTSWLQAQVATKSLLGHSANELLKFGRAVRTCRCERKDDIKWR
jgi:hypothetical protein